MATGSGIGGGNRTSVLDSTGKKGIVITEIFPESVFGDTENGRMVILGNVSADRISLDGLYLSSGMQYFAVPDGYVLDSAERLVIAYGPDSLQDQMVSWLGWPADSSVQWIWQDGYVLSNSGKVELTSWDGEAAVALDVVEYGANGLRRTFAGRDVAAASSDFASDDWSLGAVAVERRSVRNGFGEAYSWTQMRGGKSYELSDHLGNVAVVVGDRRIAFDPDTDLDVDYFEPEVLSARDFYPFGMVMPERSFSTQAYRYGFQNQEMDNEFSGTGNSYTAMFWQYDPRIGKRFNVDPKPNSSNSSYAAFLCNPILYSDEMGDTISIKGSREFINQTLITLNTMKLTKAGNILVSSLENSSRTVEISEAVSLSFSLTFSSTNQTLSYTRWGKAQNSYYDSEGGVKGQGGLAYGITYGRIDGGEYSPTDLLGHETGHAYGYWFVPSYHLRGREFQEGQAGIFGNYFRTVFGLELREEYTGLQYFNTSIHSKQFISLPSDELRQAIANPERIRFENMGDGVYYSVGEITVGGSIKWGSPMPIENLLNSSKILIRPNTPNSDALPILKTNCNLKDWIGNSQNGL
jgi:hypothetical protein